MDATLGGQMYTPWEMSGLSHGVQAANTDVNAPCSCGYIIFPSSHIQKGGKGSVFKLRMAPS